VEWLAQLPLAKVSDWGWLLGMLDLHVNGYIDNAYEGKVDETMLQLNYEEFVCKIHLSMRAIEISRESSIGLVRFWMHS